MSLNQVRGSLIQPLKHADFDAIAPRDLGLSIVALAAISIAQPILDLLGRNPEFFLARAAPPIDVILLAIVLAVILPVLLAGVVLAVHALHAPTARAVHAGMFILMVAVLTVTTLERIGLEGESGWWVIAIGVLLGIGLMTLHRRWNSVRFGLRLLSLTPLVVVGVFLLISPTSQMAWASSSSTEPFAASVGNPSPVVMVVFDEFPVASIVDRQGEIQEEHFPNLARLADDGTWFRNAVALTDPKGRPS